MKAAVLVELNAPLVLADLEVPPLDVGQVLVEIHCSGICGAQIGEIAGIKGPDAFLPHLLGHEGGGVVIEVGPGVTQVKPGDHVVMHWRKGAGIHSRPATYTWGDRQVNAGWVTTFQELAVVSENRLTPIPPDVPFEIAALMGCAVTTALGVINNDARVKIGDSLVIIGCGGVGLAVAQGAAMVSAHPIVALDVHDHKLEMARGLGATHTINCGHEDPDAAVRRIVGTAGADVVIETTGSARVIEQAYRMTAARGRTILVGVPRFDEDITIHSLPLHFGKTLSGCEGGDANPAVDIPKYLRLYRDGKLRLDGLITHRMPLADINAALEKIRAGEVGRCMVEIRNADPRAPLTTDARAVVPR
jgi:S-(hydroxymethyl)glutathione dehydrogenase / alcohol dehydrogenase